MAQHAISALALGCLYTILVMGLTLLSSAQRSWYLAYGSLCLVGAHVTWWTLRSSYPIWLALILAPLLCIMVGAVLTCLERIVRIQRSEQLQLMWGLGVLICGVEVYRLVMGTYHRKLIAMDSHQIHYLGPLMLSDMHWLLFGCAFGCGVWLHGFLTTSRLGVTVQAALNEKAAIQRWRGVDPRWIAAAIGASLAGVGGSLAALYFNDVYAELGFHLMPKVLCLVSIGGIGYLRGAVMAAFGLAYVEGVVVPMTAQMPLPVEGYLMLALFIGGLLRLAKMRPHRRADVAAGRHRKVTLDSA